MKKVVITGIGMVSPLGKNVQSTWTTLISFNGLNSYVTRLGNEYKYCKYGMLIKPDVNFKDDFRTTKACKLALVAAKEALSSAELLDKNQLLSRKIANVGCSVGTGLIDPNDVLNQKRSAHYIHTLLPNSVAATISHQFDLVRGFAPVHTVSSSCVSGLEAIGDAFNMIRHGEVDIMLCGGTESCFHPLIVDGFCAMRAMSKQFANSCPFSKNRDGFIMSEGAGFLVLESEDHAKDRKAHILGCILSYSLCGSGRRSRNLAASSSDAIFLTMKKAIEQANCNPTFVSAHAAGTKHGDLSELISLEKLEIPLHVSSFKAALGHSLAASGPIELIVTLLCCKNKVMLPTWYVNEQSVESCKYVNLLVGQHPKPWHTCSTKKIAMKNAIGFGGVNASIILEDTHKYIMSQSNEHFLEHSYNIWTCNRLNRKVNSSQQSSYEDNLKLVANFKTVEKFWALYCHLKRPEDLSSVVTDLFVFRDTVRPMWEDSENKEGGRWCLRLSKRGVCGRIWEQLLLAMIGEQFSVLNNPDEICGVALSFKYNEDMVSVWCKSSDQTSRLKDTIMRVLNLPEHAPLEFRPHYNSMNRTPVDKKAVNISNNNEQGNRSGELTT
ncbi:hypothetical protein GJ496_011123 [Pomphorhynchus laevis]|nr:hypothetical protein GJ496_011123 [Pomphorhynchus laevis]